MNSRQSTLSFQKLTCFYIQSPETTHHIIAYGLKITLKNNKAGFKYGRAKGGGTARLSISNNWALSYAPKPQEHVCLYLHRHILRRTPQNLRVLQSKLFLHDKCQLKHEAGWPRALALGGANKQNQRMGWTSRQTLNHRGTSGQRNHSKNAQERGMSKLHVTSGTKTCSRLKSILLFPCDK